MRGARSVILALLASLAVALAVAACGSSSPASTPLGSALSYYPKDSPFVMSIVTDPNAGAVKSAQAMVSRIPFATFGEAAAISRLQQLGINYDADIRPLFGNPLLVGIAGSTVHASAATRVLFAWVTKDSSTLDSLIKKLRLHRAQTYRGAALYDLSTATLAVDGATVLASTSPEEVMSALDRHANGAGMTSADFDRELGSLPKSGLVDAVGNLAAILAGSSGAAKARSVPWVAALRSYGVAVSAGSRGLSFQYTLDTSGAHLSSSELPIAPGSSPPGLAGTMPIQFGLRQPATTLAFALDAERRTSPAKYAADVAQMDAVRRKTGVDFRRDVLGQLGNSAAVESDGHRFIVRVDVINPAAAARTLRKLGSSALDVFGTHSHATLSPGPAGFETVHRAHGPSVLFGLVGSEFVAGTGSAADLRAFASAPAAAAPGAQGAAAFRVALPQLLALTLKHLPSKAFQQVLGVLGDVTGWVSSTPSALTGSATLAFK
jgi:hypothetical protein